jgi:hypothetical protein
LKAGLQILFGIFSTHLKNYAQTTQTFR